MRTLLIRLWILLGMVTATATVTVIGPATAIAGAGIGIEPQRGHGLWITATGP